MLGGTSPLMSGRSSRAKGGTYERELKSLLIDLGYGAEKVYGSGAIGTRLGRHVSQELNGDVIVKVTPTKFNIVAQDKGHKGRRKNPLTLEVEVKYRSKEFPRWLKNLRVPVVSDGMLFYPGYDVLRALLHPTANLPVKSHSSHRFRELLAESDILAVRFPKPGSESETGWVICIPLEER